MPADDLEPLPHGDLRASDADRETAVQRIQEAAADGRIGLDELDERLAAAYAAKTHGDLALVTRDLAAPPAVRPLAPAHGSRAPVLEITATMDDQKREGVWHAPAEIVARAGMGTVKLDFTEAVLETDEVHVDAIANAGSVVLLVPDGWRVDVDGVSSGMGSVRNKARPPRAGQPTLVVTGRAVMGDVIVRHPRASRWLPR